MKKLLLTMIAILAVITIASCATIVRGTQSTVELESVGGDEINLTITDRNGAEVYSGTTPATVELKKQAGAFNPAIYTIEASKEGANPVKIELRTLGDAGHFAWGAYLLGDSFLLPGPGHIVDLFTGALWKWNDPSVIEGEGTVEGSVENRKGLLSISLN